MAFNIRPPNVQSFPSLFQGPWFNVSGKDLFFSAHVDEMRGHSAALNVHSSGFTMTEPPRNIFCVCFWEETKDGVCSVRNFFTPACTTSSQSECAEEFEPSHLLADTLRVPRWCDEACEFLQRQRIRSLPGSVHHGTLHQARGPHPVLRSDRLHQR